MASIHHSKSIESVLSSPGWDSVGLDFILGLLSPTTAKVSPLALSHHLEYHQKIISRDSESGGKKALCLVMASQVFGRKETGRVTEDRP